MDAENSLIDLGLDDHDGASELRRSLLEPIEESELRSDEPPLLLANAGRSWGP